MVFLTGSTFLTNCLQFIFLTDIRIFQTKIVYQVIYSF